MGVKECLDAMITEQYNLDDSGSLYRSATFDSETNTTYSFFLFQRNISRFLFQQRHMLTIVTHEMS